ncbi:MAG TPA: hypothetical protein HA294_00875 [Nanoarchaeota archaeon]|nr:hypothetical protein [Candidatus Woesearchaeota archaeon]HIH15035.1 hypothetical protein [Nanoarchaeota archaeon]HIH58538.1 hypothetical protein [Nanoarchaeota archaeon]HIJ05520.1 hypothetical protein [Nanoarchaeota archaeon]
MTPTLLLLAIQTADAEDKTLFAGTVATEETQTLDTLIEYKQKDGLHLLTEGVLTPEAQSLSLGVQSPCVKTLLGNIQANGALDLSPDAWAYTAYAQDYIGDGSIRLGIIQDTDTLGAFLGGAYKHKFFSLDADLWHDGEDINGHGYAALVLDPLFFSLGGDPRQQKINGSLALVQPHAFGLYGDIAIDFENEAQSGKLFIADRSTITRETVDFFAHLTNGTEMRGVISGYILDSWGPFDAFRTERFGGAVRWSNTPDVFQVKTMMYAHPTDTFFVGLGARDVYTRSIGDHSLGVDLEVYTAIPKTPLETWVNIDIDLETRQSNLQLYLGGNWKF